MCGSHRIYATARWREADKPSKPAAPSRIISPFLRRSTHLPLSSTGPPIPRSPPPSPLAKTTIRRPPPATSSIRPSLRPAMSGVADGIPEVEGDQAALNDPVVVEESTEEGNGNTDGKEVVLFQSEDGNDGGHDGSDSNLAKNAASTSSSSKAQPSVGTFTVQCSLCFKWRLIPTKEKYEEIRESILEVPFNCESARKWKDGVSCDDPPDIQQDGSRVWAIDRPSIAQPPPGWQRLLRIRGEGSTKFADVYYVTPTGKKLRSMNEIEKHLLEHPEYVENGVKMSQFSFQTPRPLQENYVRKRPNSRTLSHSNLGQTSFEPEDVQPLSWASPASCTDLSISPPQSSDRYYEESLPQSIAPRKKQKIKSVKKKGYGKIVDNKNHPHGSNIVYEM